MTIQTAILTVSDRISKGKAFDKTGEILFKTLEETGKYNVNERRLTSDDLDEIKLNLKDLAARVNLIVTTGGTGFSQRDNTPEAVRDLIEKEATGLTIAMMNASLSKTELAALSRPVCGVIKNCLIITLPGSSKGALENLQSILPVLPHAIDLLTSNIPASESFHTALHGGHSCVHHSDKTSTHTTPGLSNALNLPPSSRPRISPYPLTPLSTAHTLIKSHCKPLPPFLTKTPLDHILAQDIKSEIDIPSVPTSIVDGYAMTTTTPGIYTLTGHTLANGPPLDGLVRVNTGSPLSPQTIGVVMIEDTEVDSLDLSGNEERIKVKGCTPGLNIRKVGSDVSKGQVVLAKGELVSKYGGGEVGLLASIGVKEVMVYGKPRVGVLSTGDEVGKSVLDANRPALLAVLAGYGYESVDLGIVEDDVDKITEKIKNGLEKVDVLVTTGGVSMGEADFLKTVLERKLNGIIHFGRVNVKPGKPTTFATVGERLVFSLPGNPVSALVMFRVFVLPALRRLSGHSGEELWIKVKLAHEIRLDSRPEFYRVKLEQRGGDFLIATGTGSQRSSRIQSLTGAMGLVKLPSSDEGSKVLPAGTLVDAILL